MIWILVTLIACIASGAAVMVIPERLEALHDTVTVVCVLAFVATLCALVAAGALATGGRS